MGKEMHSIKNRRYVRLFDRTFFQLNDELETESFKDRQTPIVAVCDNGKTRHYVELSDFIRTILPEITFGEVWLWKYDEAPYIRANVKGRQLNKTQLSALDAKCDDYYIDAREDCDEEGRPTGGTIDIVFPLR